MKIPGPDHPITITPATTRWRARFGDGVIADSAAALVLQEADYRPVVYFPRDDVMMEYMSRTDRVTTCPYKGQASYFTLRRHSDIAENVAWSYEDPYPAMSQIAGHIAFYPDQVEIYSVDDAVVNPHHHADAPQDRTAVDEVVQHTDAGDGRAQREPWAPNVDRPQPEGGVR
jgi:uncharacterized protein (DUF427 family)